MKLQNNYLQQLCREILEFLLYRGFPRPIWPAKYHEHSEGYFAGQIGQGNPSLSKNFNFDEKVVVHNFIVFWNTK